MAKDNATEKIGKPLNQISLHNGVEVCSFCGETLQRKRIELFGIKKDYGAQRCKCDDARAFWEDYDQKYQEAYDAEMQSFFQQSVSDLIRSSRIPKRWENRTFENFTVTENNRKAYQIAKEYADYFDSSTCDGLFFTGPVGTGKTHLAAAVALTLLNRNIRVKFGTVTTLLGEIRSTYDSDKLNERQAFDGIANAPLLVIDELGKEKVTKWLEQTMYEIVNFRYENNKPLIITTNIQTLQELRDRYENTGEAMVDRIIEICKGVQMKGESWRKRGLTNA